MRRNSILENISPLVLTRGFDMSRVTATFGKEFKLSECAEMATLAQQYDLYRIKYVKVELRWWLQPPAVLGVQAGAYNISLAMAPEVYWYVDKDDSRQPGAQWFNGRIASGQCRKRRLEAGRSVKMIMRPTPSGQVYRTDLTTGYTAMRGAPWIDCKNPDVPHYGLKYLISVPTALVGTDQTAATVNFGLLQTRIVYGLEFKHYIGTAAAASIAAGGFGENIDADGEDALDALLDREDATAELEFNHEHNPQPAPAP